MDEHKKNTPWLKALLAGGCFLALYLAYQPGSEGPGGSPVAPLTRPHVSDPIAPHESYEQVQARLARFQKEAPEWVDVGTYGESAQHKPLVYARLHSPACTTGKKVLVTGAIHGNEPLSTSVVLSYAGKLLGDSSEQLDSLDVYLVPVVSPDSYPNRREVDGVDPNRDFETHSPSIIALKNFFSQIKPDACWSGHTFGRIFMIPPGNTRQNTADEAKYQDLFGRMATLAGYRLMHGYEMYGHEIHGSEMDFYHQGGATACVCEYGTASVGGQRPARPEEIKSEMEKTWPAFLLWLKEAPTLRTKVTS